MCSSVLSDDIWILLLAIINRNISQSSGEGQKRQGRISSLPEVKKFYAIQVAIENTYGNDCRSLRKHHQVIKSKYASFPTGLGVARFELLRSCLNPTKEELVEICNKISFNSKGLVDYVRNKLFFL